MTGAQESESKVAPQDAEDTSLFTDRVQPLLEAHCLECHSHAYDEAEGLLMLDSLAAMTAGGSRGPSLVAGKPEASLLFQALTYADTDLQMPPSEKLSEEDIEVFRSWIATGAKVPPSFQGSVATGGPQKSTAENHWAYQPLRSGEHATSAEVDAATGNPIDRIVSAKLETRGLQLSPRADSRTLLRRLSYDLTGLPPNLHQFAEFEASQLAGQDMLPTVDRLLASPQFGERWARHWMDVSRYADNKGYVFQEDREYAEAYKYRDWLVRSLNQDMPYDAFIRYQLAADLIPDASPADLPALGFLTLGRRFLNNKLDIIDDRLDVVTRGLMGMTVACARCHDHKYDPISQKDYYSLFAVFLNTDEPGGEPWPHRLADSEKERTAHVLLRGVPGNNGEVVSRRFVSLLNPSEVPFGEGSGRLDLARAIASPTNPLTARVLVNRVWMQLMGTPLVDTPSDFGTRSTEPEYLELLDSLAESFVANQWSIKQLIRHIVSSRTYQQSSLEIQPGKDVDPANRLYWRMNRKRLDFESLRDTLLKVTGNLDERLYGQAVPIDQLSGALRRTVYSYIDRQNLPSVFRTFDMASPDTHTPKRPQTSVPQQGLYLMNSDFIAEISLRLSEQPEFSDAEVDAAEKANRLFQQILGRAATEQEIQLAVELTEQAEQAAPAELAERWIYGYGPFDVSNATLQSFTRLPMFIAETWQGGAELPDAKLGWCKLSALGGHPGNSQEFAVVRRWVAPRSGTVSIRGNLNHPAAEGDGVRASLLSGGKLIEQWTALNQRMPTRAQGIDVEQGAVLDFVTDCISSPNHDSFEWKVAVQYREGTPKEFRSEAGVPQPPKTPMNPWALLVQALLTTNELAFVD
ncbi:PSD1 and planctomycete cytochrome C domain-containing protein [Aureliella helgolandensis]|nr:PSD1 and planctomycete cytochrome C domain-containing protein [Aureliella helgolandensis]